MSHLLPALTALELPVAQRRIGGDFQPGLLGYLLTAC